MRRIVNGDPTYTEMNFSQLKEAMIRLINKALEIEPEKRFKSAKALADNLRKIKILCEWIRKGDDTCFEWEGRTNDKVISVMCSINGNIVTRQKLGSNSFRRISKLCYHCLKELEREAILRKILIGFESGQYR